MICPRRIAFTSRIAPAVVQSRKGTSEDSSPKAPPVKNSGPSIADWISPGSLAAPDTAPEKIPDCV